MAHGYKLHTQCCNCLHRKQLKM